MTLRLAPPPPPALHTHAGGCSTWRMRGGALPGLGDVGLVVEPGGVSVSWLLLWTVLYLALALPFLWSLCHMTRAGWYAGQVVPGPGGHAAAAAPCRQQPARVLEVDEDGPVYLVPPKGKAAGRGSASSASSAALPSVVAMEERRVRYQALTVPVLKGMLLERGIRPHPSASRKPSLIALLLEGDAAWGQRCSLAGGGGSGEAGREVP